MNFSPHVFSRHLKRRVRSVFVSWRSAFLPHLVQGTYMGGDHARWRKFLQALFGGNPQARGLTSADGSSPDNSGCRRASSSGTSPTSCPFDAGIACTRCTAYSRRDSRRPGSTHRNTISNNNGRRTSPPACRTCNRYRRIGRRSPVGLPRWRARSYRRIQGIRPRERRASSLPPIRTFTAWAACTRRTRLRKCTRILRTAGTQRRTGGRSRRRAAFGTYLSRTSTFYRVLPSGIARLPFFHHKVAHEAKVL